MKDFILVLIIWMSMMAFAFWRRHVNSKKSKAQLQEEKFRRRVWWSSNSPTVLICKFMLFLGILCVIVNSILQGIDIRRRNARMRRFRGHVAFYVVEQKFDSGVSRFKDELYNGGKLPIQIGRIIPDFLEPETVANRANESGAPIPLNDPEDITQRVRLAYDQAVRVNFAVPTNLLPNSFSIYYWTSNGCLTNAVINVGCNPMGEDQ